MNEVISYDNFCDRAGPIAPAFVDALDEGERERLLKAAWEDCAWIATLTDARIVEAIRQAIFTMAKKDEHLSANAAAAPLLDCFLMRRE